MRLTDLNPQLFGIHGGRRSVGMLFDCPCGCGVTASVYFRNPLDGDPEPFTNNGGPTWQRTGDDFETMTLEPSILRTDGCKWHGWIRNGEVVEA